MILEITIAPEVAEGLLREALAKGITPEQLVAEYLEREYAPQLRVGPVGDTRGLLEITRRLILGARPAGYDHSEIEKAVRATEPEFDSVDRAMSSLRGRSWSADDGSD
jgi:hypothetical protein